VPSFGRASSAQLLGSGRPSSLPKPPVPAPPEAQNAGHEVHKQVSTVLGVLNSQAGEWRRQAAERLQVGAGSLHSPRASVQLT
jgi:hypothetical protein